MCVHTAFGLLSLCGRVRTTLGNVEETG